MDRVLGLDLGSTHASVAVTADGGPVPVPDENERVLSPAFVHFPAEGGEPTVGLEARRHRAQDPGRVVHLVGRLLGRDFTDPVIPRLQRMTAFSTVAGPSGKACVSVGEAVYSPSEVAAALFRALKARAEAFAGEACRKAVLVVPGAFTDPQRLALRMAAQMAGVDPIRMVSQPVAAALAWTPPAGVRRVVVYSLGGGCFDACVLELAGGVYRVLGSAGDASLGADVVDEHLFGVLRDRFSQRHGVDLAEDVVASQRLWGAVENAKVHLTENPSVEVRLREMAHVRGEAVDLVDEISRVDLLPAVMELSRRSQALCEEALARAGCGPTEVDAVLLAGGGSRVPGITEGVGGYFGRVPVTEVQVDGAAALGAASYGQDLLGRAGGARDVPRRLVVDLQSHDVAVQAGAQRHRLLRRSAPLPAAARRVVTTGQEGQDSVALVFFQEDRQGNAVRVGELAVEGLKPLPPGGVKLDAVVEVDPDGIITVAVTDAATGARTPVPVRVGAEALEQDVVLLRMQRGEVRA